jgi:NSS family neurotransmitter:Na+ symporter
MSTKRAEFTNFIGFVLVSAGSAVGLGSIWRFPYLAGASGGGAFVFVFTIIIFTVGVSMLMVEFIIGRYGKANAVSSYKKIHQKFKYLGFLNIFTSFIILAYYSVIGGFTIYYFLLSITGKLTNKDLNFSVVFNNFIANPILTVLCTFLFLFFTIYIVLQGINKGIERYSVIMMPALFIIIIILMMRSITLDNAIKGIIWYIKPDFSKLNSSVLMAALGQVFFSLSIGLSTMLTYSSYLSKKEYLPKASFIIALLQLVVSIIAGFIIFPAVFSFGLNPGEGPGLIFITLPQVFVNMPAGIIFSTLFFLLLIFASITSSISMMEVAITYFIETYKIRRLRISIIYGIIVFILSIPATLSFNIFKNIKIFSLDLFSIYDYFCANLSLPFGGLMCTILVGWIADKKIIKDLYSIDNTHKSLFFPLWYFIVRFIVPFIILLIWFNNIKIF